MIKIINLSKKYGGFYALKDVDLTLPSKGLIGISGESGSGKSTLLNAIGLMEDEYQGEIIINNKNILKFNNYEKDKYHQNIGYIFQTPYLFDFCTIKDNINFISLIKEKKENINNILKIVGLEKYKNKKVNTLSGGQKQRVSIACSLISKPSILLCDEPTGSIDKENSIKVMEILKEVSKDILVVVVSHDLELLKKYANSIIYLKEGQILNKINLEKDSVKIKFNKKGYFKHFIFSFLFAFKNLFNHQKRTLLTSIMVSFGLIGIIFSILLKDGFSTFFESSLGKYESNKYLYCYNVNQNDEIEISLDTFESDFKNYDKGYFYKYNFKENQGNIINKIKMEEKDLYLNMNNLCYLIRDNYIFSDSEIGLSCSKDYLEYLFYIFKSDNINNVNKILKEDNKKINFKYSDNNINLNFDLSLKYIKESNDEHTYFIHSNPIFLKTYFNKYISNIFDDENKIIVIPYIVSEEKDKSDLLLEESKKKYDYIFDNKIYDKLYDFVISSNYYRIDINLVKRMSELVDSSYYISINNGIDMMGYFSDDMYVSSKSKEINGKSIRFQPDEYDYSSNYEIGISSGLYKLLSDGGIKIRNVDSVINLSVIHIVENDDLVIYQNSYWSYSLFRELFFYKDYECLCISIALSKSDDNTIEILKKEFVGFEFVCPLKEVKKEIDLMIEKVRLVLLILSSFCIIMSLLLMVIITFINMIEQSKIIAVLRINGISKLMIITIYLFEGILLGGLAYVISGYFAFVFSLELNMVFNSLLSFKANIVVLKKDILINVFKIVMIMSLISSFIPSLIASYKSSLKVLKS